MASTQSAYTPTRARAIKRSIDREVAKIEDSLYFLRHRVPDLSLSSFPHSPQNMQEDVREIGHFLHSVVDRRTQQ